MKARETSRRPASITTLAVALAGAMLSGGCNAVLGIDTARLDTNTDASVAADAAGGACADLGSSKCGTCVASRCCDEYAACIADPSCKKAVEVYNGCLFGPDAGTASCAEDLGTSANEHTQKLAACMFLNLESSPPKPGACATECRDTPIGDDLCSSYCGCMADFCQITVPQDCPTACAALTRAQLHCRSYHCFLGSQDMPEVHCLHAVGRLGKCQ